MAGLDSLIIVFNAEIKELLQPPEDKKELKDALKTARSEYKDRNAEYQELVKKERELTRKIKAGVDKLPKWKMYKLSSDMKLVVDRKNGVKQERDYYSNEVNLLQNKDGFIKVNNVKILKSEILNSKNPVVTVIQKELKDMKAYFKATKFRTVQEKEGYRLQILKWESNLESIKTGKNLQNIYGSKKRKYNKLKSYISGGKGTKNSRVKNGSYPMYFRGSFRRIEIN